MSHNVYEHLAVHLSTLGMGMPKTEDLLVILMEILTPAEAEVALLLPTRVAPLETVGLDEIANNTSIPKDQLEKILDDLSEKGLLFTQTTNEGKRKYALQQVGFGFPQTFFWKGEETPQSKKMAALVAKYFNRNVIKQSYAGTRIKPFRYIPAENSTSSGIQSVYPYHLMSTVIQKAKVFAVSHCPCRVSMRLMGKACGHPEEVCMKFDDMARYVINRGLGREISREEAFEVVRQSEEAGLVHFVDNAIDDIKHNCNCCGCACWNVGTIRRRKIPRDVLMATYFMRETNHSDCTGCGYCVEICPVAALSLNDGLPVVDEEWCIGCGVCVAKCPGSAAKLRLRTDIDSEPMRSFSELHNAIMKEKGLR
ncbi:MAG: 4Fe-4S binding protein [Peptococcaceae bacterium]|nr:4Fe-4S binding protein [Peptococcaceae bacterium]